MQQCLRNKTMKLKLSLKLKEHTDTSYKLEPALVRHMQVSQGRWRKKQNNSNIDYTALNVAEHVSICALLGACIMHIFSVQTWGTERALL